MTEPTAHPSSTLTDNAPWEAFRRPYVRDLAYVLACPNVLNEWLNFAAHQNTQAIAVHSPSFWQAQYEVYRDRLEELDQTNAYQELTRYLLTRPSPNRLGFHFEGLLSFWLSDGYARGLHPYEILASNVQLFCGKQTSGELDLILYNHEQGLTEHWELAIKFFMGTYPFAPKNWVGINSNDNLQRKMTHMQNKQFCIIRVDTKSHGQVKIDKRYAVIKGRFFLPMTTTDFTYPKWLETGFPMHRWFAAPNSQNHHDNQNNCATSDLLTDITAVRRSHYIEWFTQRNFYNKDENNAKIAPNLATLQQGLYFVKLSTQYRLNQQKIPYPTSYEGYEPIVILQTDVNAGQNSLLE